MNFAYRPLSSKIGAEITGLDLRQPIDADALARLRQVWLDHVIVLFAVHLQGRHVNQFQVADAPGKGDLLIVIQVLAGKQHDDMVKPDLTQSGQGVIVDGLPEVQADNFRANLRA